MTKQLTTVDHRVERALEMRANGKSWRAIAKALDCDHRGIMRAVKSRCPEAVDPQLSPKERREFFTHMNTRLLQKAGQQLDKALDNGEIEPRDLPKTYGILTDKQVKLEGWDGRKIEGEGSFIENLAKTLFTGGRKVTLELEPTEVIDVTPEDGAQETVGPPCTPTP